MSCAAETATRQSATSASATALGRVSSSRAGKTACAIAGRVGDGVAPADPRRVLRGEDREAEIGRRLLVVALLPEHRRALAVPRTGGVGTASITPSASSHRKHQKKR